MKKLFHFLALAGLASAGVSTLPAQWHTQSLLLQPGWNAVYLEVEPVPGDPDLLFAQVPVESIWAWNRAFQPVQFVQDPNLLVPENPDWLMYVPSNSPAASRKSLYKMLGGKAYLIKLAAIAAPTHVVLAGKPVWLNPDWIRDSLNLAGFSLPLSSPPSFQAFFGAITNLNAGPVYRLQPSGDWAQLALTTPMRSGEACWLRMNGRVDFPGPLRIISEQSTGLDFGRIRQEQTLLIRNESSAARTIMLRSLPSEVPPGTGLPALAGDVPLSYWVATGGTNILGWSNLPSVLVRSNLAAGAEWPLRLAVRRAEMAPYAGPVGSAGVLYQSLMEVTDASGLTRVVLPVTASSSEGPSSVSPGLVRKAPKAGQGSMPLRPGLWIGSVLLDKVSQPASFNPSEPQPTPAEFQFRILLHMDTNGTVRLLQKVLQMWQDGTTKPDPNDPSKLVVDEPGHFVLVTDESLVGQIPRLNGAALRDGTAVGRRFSTTAFGFLAPKSMTESGDTLSSTITLGYDDPLNPFKHSYHPDHDNLDERFEDKLPEGAESHTVTRQIQLQFAASDPEGLLLAGWGDNQLGGIYRETVAGLHRATIHASGRFRLQRASTTPVLNNGL
jgi:hypothetical protein